MTVKELYKELRKYLRKGWKDKPIYLCDGTGVNEVRLVTEYSLDYQTIMNHDYDHILMIK